VHPDSVPVAGWWCDLPLSRVVRVVGIDFATAARDLDPLPEGAPAVVDCRPASAGPVADQTTLLLDELSRAAVALYPAWLPDAASIADAAGAGIPAVRAVARATAHSSTHFGPFLAELATAGLCGRPALVRRFAAEVRAAGLARVIADSYQRGSAALLIEVPAGRPEPWLAELVAAAEFLAHHGGFGVWLAGDDLGVVDRLDTVRLDIPRQRTTPVTSTRTVVHLPAAVGRPRWNSPTERALERELASLPWATGRRWNQRHQLHPLAPMYFPDLHWPEARVVVELDGPEHALTKRTDDAQRDALFKQAGYVVRRFTNVEVRTRLDSIVAELEQLVRAQRPETVENLDASR
jgi:very-short-patch-repair endonuclease